MKHIKEIGEPVFSPGLENIYFAESRISYIDGQKGKLYYVGIPIEELVENSTFEEVAFLMFHQRLPKKDELEAFEQELRNRRNVPEIVEREEVELLPKDAHPMDVLNTVTTLYGMLDKNNMDRTKEEVIRKAISLTSLFPSTVAYFERIRKGQPVVKPSFALNHAANFLYMLRGYDPSEEEARIFDKTLILYVEHGMNASTFAAVVTASTQSDIYSAITSAIGTLKGPLHGGANEAVMRMLIEIDESYGGDVERFVDDKLSRKERIMGFGHRVYKAYDPRAKILKQLAIELADHLGNRKWIDLQLKLEEVVIDRLGEKKIYPNVDYFAATIYYMLGIPMDLYTPIFAIARVVGWTAHVMEYWEMGGRLLRPRVKYVGDLDVRYIPIEQR